jgi:hypothetical protein
MAELGKNILQYRGGRIDESVYCSMAELEKCIFQYDRIRKVNISV